jgi:esterase/lipase superfamily enzyme
MPINREYHRWFSSRLGHDMTVLVYGHWGAPLLSFPTSGGDEWEYENQGMIAALGDLIEAGKVKWFSAGTISGEAFYNKGAHPFHRSYVQAMFDSYIREEVVPFIWDNCRTSGIPISTFGASLGAYQAVNTLLKHPDVIKRCFGLSGQYDMRSFMNGLYDDNFYFNNPVDYVPNLNDPWILNQLSTCDIHLATGHGPWENSGPTRRLAAILASKNIPHHLDDWREQGGHDWPFWKHQMREYIQRLF